VSRTAGYDQSSMAVVAFSHTISHHITAHTIATDEIKLHHSTPGHKHHIELFSYLQWMNYVTLLAQHRVKSHRLLQIVTVDEYKKWDEGNAEAIHDFNVLDRNHDGKLTRVELSGTEDHSAGSNYISHEEHEQHKQERHEKHMKSRQEAMEKAQALGENPAEAATKADHESEEEDDDDEELEEHQLRAEFDRMDTDKDHHVSEEEYAAANPGDETARHNFKLIDRNKSGKLRFKELFPETVRKKDLHYYEGKHNEHYTGDEGKDATAHEHPPDHEEPAIYAPHHEAPATGVPETGEMTEADKALQTKFVGFDSNGDTRLSAAEAEAAGLRDEEGSVKADSNKDGFVDWEEFRIWRK